MNIVYCLVKVFRQGVYFASPPSRSGRCDFCFDHGHRNAIKNVKFWAHLSDTRKPPQLSIVSCIQLKKGGCNSVLSVTLFLTLYPTSFSFSVCHLGGRIYPLIDFVPVGNFYKLLTKLSWLGWRNITFNFYTPPPSTQEVLRRRFHYLKICLFDPPWLMTN